MYINGKGESVHAQMHAVRCIAFACGRVLWTHRWHRLEAPGTRLAEL